MVLPLGSHQILTLPPGKQIQQAAVHFEALLLEHLLRTVREAARSPDDRTGLSGGAETYIEIAEQHLALALADRGGLGISRMILRNVGNSVDKQQEGE